MKHFACLARSCPAAIFLAATLFVPLCFASPSDSEKHKPNTKLWESEKEAGEAAFKNRQFSEAETHFKAALAEAENFDATDYRLAESLTELGDFYARAGRFTEAEPYLQRAVEIRRGDPNRLAEAYAQMVLGYTRGQLGHFSDAEKALLRAEELYSRKYGPDSPFAAQCSFYLAAVYEDQQNYAKAESQLKRCLDIFEHPMARTRNFNPGDHVAHNRSDVWLPRFRPEMDYALETRVRLGLLYVKQNRAADAEAMFKEALKLIDDRLAKNEADSLALLPLLDEQAIIFIKLNRDADLEGVYKHQLAIYEKMFGPKNKALLKTLNNYAALLRKMKRDSEAKALEARVKAIEGANQ